MGKHAVRFLTEYISKVRPELCQANTHHLFINKYGKPLSKQIISIMIRTHAKAAGINKQVTAHTFRHTCATGMLRNKADLNTIRKILGHASLTTTQIYTHLTIADLKAVHKKCHPREKDKV